MTMEGCEGCSGYQGLSIQERHAEDRINLIRVLYRGQHVNGLN